MGKIVKNPFIVIPGELWADRKYLWEKLMEYIELARMTKRNEIIILVGDYGCGTTHTLRYLEKFLTTKGAFVCYMSTPVEATLSSIFKRLLENIPHDKRNDILNDLLELILETSHIDTSMLSMGEIEETKRALLNLVFGRRLSLRQRELFFKLGIEEELPPEIELWERVISQLVTEEWPVFILLDEFDVAISPFLRLDIRRIFDEIIYGLCIVIGLKGTPEDVKDKLGQPLYSRMSLTPIYMPPLSKTEGIAFLKDILNKRYKEDYKFPYPFKEDAIETLVELVCPCQPRRLLRICSVIFEAARKEEAYPIDKNFVLKIIRKFAEISFIQKPRELIKEKPSEKKEEKLFKDIIEYNAEGVPHILVSPKKLTAKEAIGLILYAVAPVAISMRELKDFVSLNWKSVSMPYLSANLSQMRELVIREGRKGTYKYKLSGLGKAWVENELLPKLRKS